MNKEEMKLIKMREKLGEFKFVEGLRSNEEIRYELHSLRCPRYTEMFFKKENIMRICQSIFETLSFPDKEYEIIKEDYRWIDSEGNPQKTKMSITQFIKDRSNKGVKNE